MIVSDNDPYITPDEARKIAGHFGITPIILHNAGHINTDSGYGKWELIEKLVIKNGQ